MKVSFFIDRPVFSAVISIVIVIVGIIGLTMLPVDQYPQITPPVVKISASYPGASALTVSQAVATPIEQEINGTPGMLYMESNSSNSGGFSATVTFDVSADPDLAAVEIQNRVKLAESRLPAEVIQNGISVEKQAPSQLMTLCLTSTDPKFDEIYLSNFATINVLDVIRRIPGVKNAIQYTVPVDEAVDQVRSGSEPKLTTRDRHTRECYVVAQEGANKAEIENAIKTMPNYFDEYNTTVHFISEEELKRDHSKMPHGGFVIRTGETGEEGNKHVIEYSLKLDSNPEFTASVLIAYARAAYRLNQKGENGARSVFDIAPALLSMKTPEQLRKEIL